MADLRKQLRAITVGSKNIFKKEIEKFGGNEFEIRQPTVALKSKIMQKCRVSVDEDTDDKEVKTISTESFNLGAMQVWSVIYCTYEPGTDNLVFEETDEPALSQKPAGSFVDQFSATAMKLMNVQPEEDAKN